MSRLLGVVVGIGLLVWMACGLSACGGGEDAVVRVGRSSISQRVLSHWMGAIVAGDYRDEIGRPAPEGLVSDPANYGRCVAAASAIGPRKAPATIVELCHELYQAVKLQTVSFLIDALWHIEDAKQHGESVSIKEIERRYRSLKARELSQPGQFKHYLAEVHRTLADEYYLFERNILTDRIIKRLKQQASQQGGGQTTAERLAEEWIARWTARTDCQAGYVASQCRQYKQATASNIPSPNHILLQLAGQA